MTLFSRLYRALGEAYPTLIWITLGMLTWMHFLAQPGWSDRWVQVATVIRSPEIVEISVDAPSLK